MTQMSSESSREFQVPEKVIIAGFMILQGFASKTIEFATKISPELRKHKQMSCTEMAIAYGCSTQAASRHVRALTARGYLNRVSYRAWEAALLNLENLMEMQPDETT